MGWLQETLVANGGAGSPESFGRVVVAKAIFDFITSDCISDIAVSDGGDNYIVGETFDIVVPLSPGDVLETFTARGVVVSVGSGSPSASPDSSVTRVKIISGGAYSNLTQSPELNLTNVPTTNASASGTGLTVDLTTEQAHWTEDRGNGAQSPLATGDYVDDRTDFEWICTSMKATNPPIIGMESAESGGNGGVKLMVCSGFDKSQTHYTQQDASPEGPLLLCPGTDPQLYISSTERRVNIMIRDGNFCQYGTIGFFIPFTDTEANYPFPGAVFGQTSGFLPFSTSYDDIGGANPAAANAGILHPMTLGDSAVDAAAYYILENTSPVWRPINKMPSQSTVRPYTVWPNSSGENDLSFTHAPTVSGHETDPADAPINGIFSDDASDGSGWFLTASAQVNRGAVGIGTIGLNNRLSFVVKPHILKDETGYVQAVGLTDGYEAVHGVGLTAFEEIVQHGGKRYVIFPDTNSGTLYHWVAMEIT